MYVWSCTHVVWAHILHVCSESLIQPNVAPPFHGDQVAEPRVRQFMRDNNNHIILVRHGGAGRVVQKIRFPETQDEWPWAAYSDTHNEGFA
jgi:hypothetical protein